MFWDFYPWSERGSEPEPRIREELTESARVRLANIMKQIDGDHIQKGYQEMMDYTGQEIEGFSFHSRSAAKRSQNAFIRNEDRDIDIILDYLEYVLNVAFSNRRSYDHSTKVEIVFKIERTFVDEGILVQVKPSAQELTERSRYRPSKHELLQFQQVSDETIIEADQEVRTLALGERWEEPLAPYNKAWQLYKDGTHTTDIIEKLYNSLELTTEKICSELNDWEDEEQSVGRYLHVLKEKGIFNESPQMSEEATHIGKAMEVTLHRMGGDRKRHIDIKPGYCIFMLHQTSAYLSYIVKRYEKEYE